MPLLTPHGAAQGVFALRIGNAQAAIEKGFDQYNDRATIPGPAPRFSQCQRHMMIVTAFAAANA